MRRLLSRTLSCLAALGLLALAACDTGTGETSAKAGDGAARTLTIAISQFPSTWHPMLDAMLAKSYLHGLSRRPVVAYGPDWELRCMLCTELPTLENGLAEREQLPNGDTGIAVTYTLKEGLSWADGEPVTSADVRHSWQVGKHPKTGVVSQQIYERIRDIEIVDQRTFTVHIDRVTYDYNATVPPILPRHRDRAAFEQDPAQYRHQNAFDRDPTDPGLYMGPYKMVSVQRGVRAVYERNPHWPGKKPAFDRIIVRAIQNTAAMEANLLSGTVDMIAGETGLSIDQALALETRHPERFQYLYQPGLVYEHIEFNLQNPIVGDRRVRRALAYGANRRAISEQLFDGKQPVALHNVNPRDPAFTDEVKHYPYDLARARKLLGAAGWTNQEPGQTRTNAQGEPLRLTIMTTAGNRTRELVQQVLQSDWRRIGVDLQIVNEPPRVFFGQTVSGRAWEHMAMFAWLSSPGSVPRSTLHSEQIPEKGEVGGQNYKGYANPRVDELIDKMERELNDRKRVQLWHELLKIYARDLPALPLYWRAQAFVLPPWLTGVEPTGHQYPTTLWVEDWGIRGADGDARADGPAADASGGDG
ncbi:hypothetical protein CKO28_10050 [Rhodovibrio sodomensis]|uniref:Solute-binding protein family 5 domain-containing protein n=1 Tax=Rhodovibrio sodomensis TaxID=1088 RepID=A0ABS1DEK2_9PROT|nr:hypothetical protein [Rhodovibrio sodomensis]